MTTIFVFGSNLAGRHGAGAAKHAYNNYGAVYRQGLGRQGDSYAIATKDENLNTLSLDAIRIQIQYYFKAYVEEHDNDLYKVTAIGCGLAGYKPEQIAPMFKWAVNRENIILPEEFIKVLND